MDQFPSRLAVSPVVETVDEDVESAVGRRQPHGQELESLWTSPAGQTLCDPGGEVRCVASGKRQVDHQKHLQN